MNPSSRARTLLIVEDNKDVRTIFAEVFQGAGYQVLEAGNGEDALALMASTGAPVDVVLTDLRMPVMDGFELASRIKADVRFSTIPVVLLSATPMSNSWQALGVFAALLTKPCSFEQLLTTIEAVQ
ncbi:receiver domain-containing protein [Herbaspirillum sp. GW103]|jgi:CheY-like chemotaxis protein|uniref:response regulator n=1 Tax=unclassified Herbaspirillum TaxID=2624150 RepID=UPI00025E26F9|nr:MULTISPECIES: response regulator [unclassified Herbaspirillum]EIJ45861.1 receiver domain-containing protein [Herbaspirillum sp. GW103]MCI1003298.1 response regulator [Herbaspirillum sp. C7C8]NUT62026.1 response regulator [Herbaspirillum sp. C9C3]